MKILNTLNIKNNPQFDWTVELAANPNVRVFSPDIIKKYLKKHNFEDCKLDSYSLSPAYYTMTGRKGAWVYEKNDTIIVICDHPNAEGKALIFPEIGKGGILQDLIEEMPVPLNGYQLARVPAANTRATQEKLYSKYPNMNFIEVPEYAQDWLFPTHILCTKSVVNMDGRKFHRAKNRLKQFTKHKNITTKTITKDFVAFSRQEIDDLISRWSFKFTGSQDQLQSWLGPLHFMLELVAQEKYQLRSSAIYCDGQLESISIYEKPVYKDHPANFMIAFFDSSIKGISEYTFHAVCKEAYNQGIKTINLGGSETEHLDRFKRKFNPIESKSLSTIEIK